MSPFGFLISPLLAGSLLVMGPVPDPLPVFSRPLTLAKSIDMAWAQSPAIVAARHRLRIGYWQHATARADYRPSLSLEFNGPSLSRSLSRYSLSNGTDVFIRRSVANSAAMLSLSMGLAATGGQLSLNSGLQRIDVFGPPYERSYLATPVTIGIRQPLFAYNDAKWRAKLEPLEYDETQRQYLEDVEGIAVDATGYFFDLLNARTSLEAALAFQANSDSLLALARRRRGPDPNLENELLQLELASLNAHAQVTRSKLDLATRRHRLNSFLGLGDAEEYSLVPLSEPTLAQVDVDQALAEAKKNRARSVSFERELLEADRSLARASEGGATTWFSASYGLSRSTDDIQQVWRNPGEQQDASLGVMIPIMDWGRRNARREVARSNQELVRTQVQQSREDFEREVLRTVMEFNAESEQLAIATRADSLAQRRYRMTREKYVAGKGTVDALNIAQNEKDNSLRSHLEALRAYWTQYYELRRSTLYDFRTNAPLQLEPGDPY